jgi:putative tricarboxylic transport membrane protein
MPIVLGALVLSLTLVVGVVLPGPAESLAQLRLIVPAMPGGGWDQTGRAIERTLREEKLVTGAVRITNLSGGGGTIGLTEFTRPNNDGAALMVLGLGLVGAIQISRSPVTLDHVTPIARLTSEPLVIVVPVQSKIRSLTDFTAALKKGPDSVTIAGGPRGGSAHILAVLVADTVGVPARKVNYMAFAGGGEAAATVVAGHAAAAIGAASDFQAHIGGRKMRALGVSATTRVPDLDVPTLKEQGTNVDFGHWRGVVARAGIQRTERKVLLDTIEKMAKSSTWQAELKKHRWDAAYLAGDHYAAFIKTENERVGKVLKDVGLVK